MIKNKALHAVIIGTCIFANSIAGVYADTTTVELKTTALVQQVNNEDQLTQKQNEIDRYVFGTNAKDFADKGLIITHTGVVAGKVEVGITPYNQENADYLYGIFGKDMVYVIEGIQASTLGVDNPLPEVAMQTAIPVKEEVSSFSAFFANVLEWLKDIF